MKPSISWLNHILNFVAVILGVFLAFYISERARMGNQNEEMAQFKESLFQDLEEDKKAYASYHIPINTEAVEQIDTLIQLLSTQRWEEINQALPLLFSIENYTPTAATYNTLEASGKLTYFDDLSLQNAISGYYLGLIMECEAKNEAQVDYFISEVVPWLVDHSDFETMRLTGQQEVRKLKNLLIFYQVLVRQKKEQYELILQEATSLQEVLKEK